MAGVAPSAGGDEEARSLSKILFAGSLIDDMGEGAVRASSPAS
jgi:hypothetical protein